MKIKSLLISVLLIILLYMLTGCWGKKELSELSMVVAMGLDKDSTTGEFIVTNQVVLPSDLKKETGNTESPVKLNVENGSTVFEAVRNITKKFDRKQFYAHCKIIVINEQYARQGIMGMLDFMTRAYEIRDSVYVVIAKQSSANGILRYNNGAESIQGAYLYKIINNQKYNSEAVNVDLLDFVKKQAGEGINPVLGVMTVQKEVKEPAEDTKKSSEKSIYFDGLAVFKKDKLQGYLDSKETRGYNWIVGKVESGVINVPSPGESDKLITLEITGSKAKIIPQLTDGEISFDIYIKVESNLVEEQGISDLSKINVMKVVEEEQKKVVENEINSVIQKVQNEYQSDILGFGVAFSKKYPKEWKEIKNNWDEIFPKVKYTVKIKSFTDKSGVVKEPIKAPAE